MQSQKYRNMEAENVFALVSMEGNTHRVGAKVLEMSEYLKGMNINGSIQNNTVTLENIKDVSLARIVEFCIFLFLLYNCRYLSCGQASCWNWKTSEEQ